MYCSTCATPLALGLSYCNRCGVSLKEASATRLESNTGSVTAFLAAIVLVGIVGLGTVLGGVLALNKDHLPEQVVGFFMFFSFLLVAIIELVLGRQLSRLISSGERKVVATPPQPVMQGEFRPAQPQLQPRTLPEPIPSVTENTTRTLDYSRNEPLR
jgi:ABC-type dipeptide/oligopeptide/nickel transport system permease component